jgi:Lysine methyltransferase
VFLLSVMTLRYISSLVLNFLLISCLIHVLAYKYITHIHSQSLSLSPSKSNNNDMSISQTQCHTNTDMPTTTTSCQNGVCHSNPTQVIHQSTSSSTATSIATSIATTTVTSQSRAEQQRARVEAILAKRAARRRQRNGGVDPDADNVDADGNPVKKVVGLLPGPAFPMFDFSPPSLHNDTSTGPGGSRRRPRLLIGERVLSLVPRQQHRIDEAKSGHAVATAEAVWDCSVMLLKMFEHTRSLYETSGFDYSEQSESIAFPLPQLHDRTIVELGSGTGLLGLGMALLPGVRNSRIIITDVEDVQPQLQSNADLHRLLHCAEDEETSQVSSVSAATVDWLDTQSAQKLAQQELKERSGIDVIVAADVVWLDDLVQPLVDTLAVLTDSMQHQVDIWLAYQSRSVFTDEQLFNALKRLEFTVTAVPDHFYDPAFISRRITVYRIHRKI